MTEPSGSYPALELEDQMTVSAALYVLRHPVLASKNRSLYCNDVI